MARAPKVNMPHGQDHRARADAYGSHRSAVGARDGDRWEAGHRAPDSVTGMYGQLDGVCLENPDRYDNVSEMERRAFPGDCPE